MKNRCFDNGRTRRAPPVIFRVDGLAGGVRPVIEDINVKAGVAEKRIVGDRRHAPGETVAAGKNSVIIVGDGAGQDERPGAGLEIDAGIVVADRAVLYRGFLAQRRGRHIDRLIGVFYGGIVDHVAGTMQNNGVPIAAGRRCLG